MLIISKLYLCSFLDLQGENMEVLGLLPQLLHLLVGANLKVSSRTSCLQVI